MYNFWVGIVKVAILFLCDNYIKKKKVLIYERRSKIVMKKFNNVDEPIDSDKKHELLFLLLLFY